jgi:dinuclear metal center YbgI/SA1388 family protein
MACCTVSFLTCTLCTMQIKDITTHLEATAPRHLQESYDNAGLITGRAEWQCTGVLFALDSTEAIIAEAVRVGANLVVAHHPIVFRGMKTITGANYVERTIIQAIKHDVAIYAIHTNLDNVLKSGVNEMLAQKIGLKNLRILAPKDPEGLTGAGVVGELNVPQTETAFLAHVKTVMQCGVVKHTELLHQPVVKVAVCGGAGSFLLPQAVQSGAQFFVTSDYKYHEFFDADGQIVIADIGHYESEQYTIELLFSLVSEKFPTFALHLTQQNTNPVRYH